MNGITNVQTNQPAPTVSTVDPCSVIIQISMTLGSLYEFCVTFVLFSDICDIL